MQRAPYTTIAEAATPRGKMSRCAHRASAPRHSMAESEHRRSIRSFVTRAGRITPAQERALAQLLPRYGVGFAPELLDMHALFGRAAPRTLEIGFGNGENLLELASAHPERDFLGVEVHRPGVGRLLLAIEARALGNVRIICHDAVEVLERQIAPGTLD